MNIFAQYLDTKFINSLSYCTSVNIAIGDIQNNLYQLHYKYKFNTYIFCSNLLTMEILQFIREFHNSTKCIIYHPHTATKEILKHFDGTNCTHWSHEPSLDNIILIPPLVNKHIFINNPISKRQIDMVSFLDYKYNNLPPVLEPMVYPQSNMKFQLFTRHFLHPQNLGAVTEIDKANILNRSRSYLSIESSAYDYSYEALLCGNEVLKFENGELITTMPPHAELLRTCDEFIGEYL